MTERLMETEKMPDEIWAYKQPYQKTSGTWSLSSAKRTFKSRKPIGERTRYIRADLCATAGDAEANKVLKDLEPYLGIEPPISSVALAQLGGLILLHKETIRKLLGRI